jgi:DNA-binding Lrp family transcriptional regulator
MIDSQDWDIIERLQQGFPLCATPFAAMAADVGMAEDEFLSRTRRLVEAGIIRRLGPRVRHHRVGIEGNIMAVWCVPPERRQEVGELFAADEHVSHCYARPAFEGFRYTLYTMIHARDVETARGIAQTLSERSGLTDFQLLSTVRELKKASPRYRRPEGENNDNPQV